VVFVLLLVTQLVNLNQQNLKQIKVNIIILTHMMVDEYILTFNNNIILIHIPNKYPYGYVVILV